MLQGWTLGQNHSVIHAIALYTMGDVHRATIVLARNCRNVGQRETDIRTACPDVLTASSPSPSFPHSPPDLPVHGPAVVPRDTGGITVQ